MAVATINDADGKASARPGGARYFLKTTLVGGLLFVVPLMLIVVVIREAIRTTSEAIKPVVVKLIPVEYFGGIAIADLVAITAVVLLCLVAGLVLRTRLGQNVGGHVERLVLRRVPGFTLVQGVTRGLAGLQSDSDTKVALSWIEDAWVLSFILEKHSSGLYTVFVPSAPTPAAGTVYYLPEGRLKLIDVPVWAAVACVMRLGVGSRELLEGKVNVKNESGMS
jgi:uncharacterized membrane protein